MTGSLRSWWSFLTSRTKPDTQQETRVIAERIQTKLTELWPEAMKALMQ
jgi:thymidylate synthase ThyX